MNEVIEWVIAVMYIEVFFLELIHMQCKDIAWLKGKLDSHLQKHAQWTSPVVQNELLQIIIDLISERITNDVISQRMVWYHLGRNRHQILPEQNKFHFALVSPWMERKQKHSFISTPRRKSTEGEQYRMKWRNLLSLNSQSILTSRTLKIKPFRNALGTIQALFNFLEATLKSTSCLVTQNYKVRIWKWQWSHWVLRS